MPLEPFGESMDHERDNVTAGQFLVFEMKLHAFLQDRHRERTKCFVSQRVIVGNRLEREVNALANFHVLGMVSRDP